jgi:hypothetical protein
MLYIICFIVLRSSEEIINGTIFDLVLLDDPAAKCLDGSQATYYISRGGDPKKFFL